MWTGFLPQQPNRTLKKLVCFGHYGYTCLETKKSLWNNKGFMFRWRFYLLSPVLQPLGQKAGLLIGCWRTGCSGRGSRRTAIALGFWMTIKKHARLHYGTRERDCLCIFVWASGSNLKKNIIWIALKCITILINITFDYDK